MEKYMMIPVTSTNVATNGAEDTAGSYRSFFNKKGNIEPTRLPHNTIPMSVQKIVEPTSI